MTSCHSCGANSGDNWLCGGSKCYDPIYFPLDTPRPYSVPMIHAYSRTVPPRVLRPRTTSKRKRPMDGPRWPQRGYRR